MTDLTSAAAQALAAALPTAATLTPVLRTGRRAGGTSGAAVVASFVGSPSADFAVHIFDDDAIAAAIAGDKSATLTAADVLLPALNAAAFALGSGVLGEASTADASFILSDESTVIYDLTNRGTAAGWFAVRLRSVSAPRQGDFVASKLGRINAVEMSLTVEIGRTKMSIRDVLDLEPGAVVELDRSAGAPADILLNGRLIAHGEVVVVDQDYAVRVTKILDALDGLI